MNTDDIRVYRVFYKAAKAQVQKAHDDYAANVKEWYETGDGSAPNWVRAGDQPWFTADPYCPEHGTEPTTYDNCSCRADRLVNVGGKGYRYPVCIHGTDLTTDYDNICGGCESGETKAQVASAIARPQWRRWQWVMSAPGGPSGVPSQIMTDLTAWVFEVNRF